MPISGDSIGLYFICNMGGFKKCNEIIKQWRRKCTKKEETKTERHEGTWKSTRR